MSDKNMLALLPKITARDLVYISRWTKVNENTVGLMSRKKVLGRIPMGEAQLKILRVLADAFDDGYFCYLSFDDIKRRGELTEASNHIRILTRLLARKGLAEYGKGLWTEDGEPAGAGYCCTTLGKMVWDYWEERGWPDYELGSSPKR